MRMFVGRRFGGLLTTRGVTVACAALICGAVVSSLGFAKDGNPAFVDGSKAGIDFKIQGEYVGRIDADGSRWGVQVVALGDGQFRSIGFLGGLPGDGWESGDTTTEADGKLSGDTATFTGDLAVLKIDGRKVVVESHDGEQYGTLPKVERKSSTLGAKPPEGAVVLFDGSNVDHWENGKLTEDKLLAATGTQSKELLGDHQLHIEFRTPFMPLSRGQARGNSGVYIQSRYELQVLDSFGLEPKDNECGGIYSISKPEVNVCFPPLSWQTYDIDFQAAKYDASGTKTENARATVRHNGIVIHDDLELPHGTPGRWKEQSGFAPLFLQDHGNPVAFRNIWVTGSVE